MHLWHLQLLTSQCCPSSCSLTADVRCCLDFVLVAPSSFRRRGPGCSEDRRLRPCPFRELDGSFWVRDFVGELVDKGSPESLPREGPGSYLRLGVSGSWWLSEGDGLKASSLSLFLEVPGILREKTWDGRSSEETCSVDSASTDRNSMGSSSNRIPIVSSGEISLGLFSTTSCSTCSRVDLPCSLDTTSRGGCCCSCCYFCCCCCCCCCCFCFWWCWWEGTRELAPCANLLA